MAIGSQAFPGVQTFPGGVRTFGPQGTSPVQFSESIFVPAQNKGTFSFPAGSVVARHSSGSGIVLAANTGAITFAVGLAASGAASGFLAQIQTSGILTLPDWSMLVGAPTLQPLGLYWLGSSPGSMVTTAPLIGISQLLGYAVSPTSFLIAPQPYILL